MGVGKETSQGSDPLLCPHPESAHTCFFPEPAGVRKGRDATGTSAAARTEEPWRWAASAPSRRTPLHSLPAVSGPEAGRSPLPAVSVAGAR